MVRGFDTFLEDLLINRGFAEELMDRILAIEIDIVSGFLNAVGPHIDIIAFKDDLAMQSGPIVSPALFREAIKPRMRKLIEAIRSRTQAKIWFHSCGSVYFAIPDLIELGIDVLNPVQVRAVGMDTARLKREFGQHLAFWGGIDTQHVLPFGTPEDVRREVRQRIQDLAPGGGYVLASVHNIEADVPGENIWAMVQAAHEYGRYPIHKSIW
jgi:uroporphyrinogen decarboxylase